MKVMYIIFKINYFISFTFTVTKIYQTFVLKFEIYHMCGEVVARVIFGFI